MYVVMGATGNVGGAVAETLLDAGEQVVALVHDAAKGEALRTRGAEIVAADVRDVASLREAFRRGKRAFLLNPPADVSGDSDAEETANVRAIADALEGSGLEKVVVQSVIAARAGRGVGDLTVLHDLEERAQASGIPTAINRGGYYFSNFDALLEPAKQGTLPTMFPADQQLAMVAPADLGRAAADRLRSGTDDVGVRNVAGPAERSFADVAAAFAKALGREVTVQSIPPEGWHEAYKKLGFSDASAAAYGRMTQAAIDDSAAQPEPDVRGEITLDAYIRELVSGRG